MALPSLRPRSLSGLLLLGLAVVAMPLLLGTISAAVEMRNLATASERLVLNGVAATQFTQALVRQVAALERTARLYQILRRPVLLETFQQNRRLFEQTLDGLEELPGDPERTAEIEGLRATIEEISAGLASNKPGRLNESLKSFSELAKGAGTLSALAGRQTDRELKQLRDDTEQARRRLYWQSAALIPVTLGLAFVFALLLGRPIRQIDAAIDDIGHGRLGNPVKVQGPADLRALGRQLEWLRRRLSEVAEERNRFLRHMSHELKTPLASIREGTELMLEGAVGTLAPDQREVAGILRDNSLRLQRQIENLLSYSEWQARQGALELSEVRLQQVVRNAIEAYQLPISSHGIRLEQDIEDLTLVADRAKLQLIIDNLVSNAVKFTPDGGSIYISARSEGGEGGVRASVIIDVADTGPGIPQEEREKIFEAFYQGATRQGGLVRGTGIGLSVAQEFVQAHGGTIEVVEAARPGAHFRVRLPANRPANEPIDDKA